MHIELAKKCINEGRLEAAREHAQQAIAADATKPEVFNRPTPERSARS